MKVVGLDIASHTGMAMVGDYGEEEWGLVHLPEQHGFKRLQSIADKVRTTLELWQPKLVVIEGYAFSKNVDSFIMLVEIGTIIRATLYDMKLPWVEVGPTTLKKWATGNGAATKIQMAVAARQKWSFNNDSFDVIDAYCLARMGKIGVGEMLKLPGVSMGI